MELIRQAVPHGYAGILGQFLHDLLVKAPVLNAVVHPAQDPGGVGNALLFAHLAAAGIQIGDPQAKVHAGHLEGAAGSGGGFLKEQNDVLSLQIAVRDTVTLHIFELLGQVQQIPDLLRCVVQQLQKMSATNIYAHNAFSFS